jgi:hypothetical protein
MSSKEEPEPQSTLPPTPESLKPADQILVPGKDDDVIWFDGMFGGGLSMHNCSFLYAGRLGITRYAIFFSGRRLSQPWRWSTHFFDLIPVVVIMHYLRWWSIWERAICIGVLFSIFNYFKPALLYSLIFCKTILPLNRFKVRYIRRQRRRVSFHILDENARERECVFITKTVQDAMRLTDLLMENAQFPFERL